MSYAAQLQQMKQISAVVNSNIHVFPKIYAPIVDCASFYVVHSEKRLPRFLFEHCMVQSCAIT